MPASKGRPETGKFASGIRNPSQSSGLRFPFDLMISFRVAGGSPGWQAAGLFHSALHPVLKAVLNSVLRDRLGPLPAVIDSAQPEAARSARSADPTSRQCPEITKNDEPRTENSLEPRYVVTRSRPYPARRSREVEADSGLRLGTQPRQTRAARGAAPTRCHRSIPSPAPSPGPGGHI